MTGKRKEKAATATGIKEDLFGLFNKNIKIKKARKTNALALSEIVNHTTKNERDKR